MGQLVDVQSKLETEKEQLEKNQNSNNEKYKKNTNLLKKQAEEKTRLQERLQKYAKKIKDLDKQLQHVLTIATEQSKSSTTTKIKSAYFSSSQEQGLQKPRKQPRVDTK
jgi:predicted nuclease with TOPRIM domain